MELLAVHVVVVVALRVHDAVVRTEARMAGVFEAPELVELESVVERGPQVAVHQPHPRVDVRLLGRLAAEMLAEGHQVVARPVVGEDRVAVVGPVVEAAGHVELPLGLAEVAEVGAVLVVAVGVAEELVRHVLDRVQAQAVHVGRVDEPADGAVEVVVHLFRVEVGVVFDERHRDAVGGVVVPEPGGVLFEQGLGGRVFGVPGGVPEAGVEVDAVVRGGVLERAVADAVVLVLLPGDGHPVEELPRVLPAVGVADDVGLRVPVGHLVAEVAVAGPPAVAPEILVGDVDEVRERAVHDVPGGLAPPLDVVPLAVVAVGGDAEVEVLGDHAGVHVDGGGFVVAGHVVGAVVHDVVEIDAHAEAVGDVDEIEQVGLGAVAGGVLAAEVGRADVEGVVQVVPDAHPAVGLGGRRDPEGGVAGLGDFGDARGDLVVRQVETLEDGLRPRGRKEHAGREQRGEDENGHRGMTGERFHVYGSFLEGEPPAGTGLPPSVGILHAARKSAIPDFAERRTSAVWRWRPFLSGNVRKKGWPRKDGTRKTYPAQPIYTRTAPRLLFAFPLAPAW